MLSPCSVFLRGERVLSLTSVNYLELIRTGQIKWLSVPIKEIIEKYRKQEVKLHLHRYIKCVLLMFYVSWRWHHKSN